MKKETRWRCLKHLDKFVCPSRQKVGRHTGCTTCKYELRISTQAKEKRANKWGKQFIACALHSERRCNRSTYIGNGKRRCGSCKSRSANGILKSSHKKRVLRAARKRRHEERMISAAEQPLNRKSIVEILRMKTGFAI